MASLYLLTPSPISLTANPLISCIYLFFVFIFVLIQQNKIFEPKTMKGSPNFSHVSSNCVHLMNRCSWWNNLAKRASVRSRLHIWCRGISEYLWVLFQLGSYFVGHTHCTWMMPWSSIFLGPFTVSVQNRGRGPTQLWRGGGRVTSNLLSLVYFKWQSHS